MKYVKTFRDALKEVRTEDFDDINRQRGSKHISAKDDSKDDVKSLKNQIQMLKIELENEKNKTVKPEPTPDTVEFPLRTGVAQALLDKDTPNPKIEKDNKKKFKMSLGKSEVKVDPDVKIGVAAGGNETGSGNLH